MGAAPPLPYPTSACPYCGSRAALAEARGLEQLRLLRCTLCAAAWHAPRLACPHCRSSNPQDLESQAIEGQHDRARLVTCRVCGGSLKIIATLAPLSAASLLVADLATIHLDLA
jgi:FdhE protein